VGSVGRVGRVGTGGSGAVGTVNGDGVVVGALPSGVVVGGDPWCAGFEVVEVDEWRAGAGRPFAGVRVVGIGCACDGPCGRSMPT
jgi:hypothetical protein